MEGAHKPAVESSTYGLWVCDANHYTIMPINGLITVTRDKCSVYQLRDALRFCRFSVKLKLTEMLKKKDFVTAIRLLELMKVEFSSDPLFSSAQSNDAGDADDDAESIQNKIDIVIGQLKSVFFGKPYKYLQKTDEMFCFRIQFSSCSAAVRKCISWMRMS